MKKIFLSPSMMCGDLLNLKEELIILRKNKFDYFHLDIMDGHFVPNITFGFDLVNKITDFASTPRDIHLMMDYPDMAVRALKLKTGDVVSFHVECKSNPDYTIKHIKDKNGKVGIAINPDTPIENVFSFLDKIDFILIMTVYPGFAGHPFVKTSYKRATLLAKIIKEHYPHVLIGVDGAIGFEEITKFYNIGVDLFVLGTTALFKGNLIEQAPLVSRFVEKLQELKQVKLLN